MADPGVGAPLRHQGEHLTLACGEHGERVVRSTGADEFLHQGRVDHRVPVRDPLDRLDEFAHVGDPALEEVPDPLAGGQQFHGLFDLDKRRQHEDPDVGELLPDGAGSIQALR